MSKIKRYDCYLDSGCGTHYQAYMDEVDNGNYVKYDDIKHLLNTSDNSDYEATPKLPRFIEVYEKCTERITKSQAAEVYRIIKRLGNFS